jgi:hypothetical protein
MQIALTRLDQALRDLPAQLIATVHDEAVLLVRKRCFFTLPMRGF